MANTTKYQWDDLKKSGDSFITKEPITKSQQYWLSNYAKRRKGGYKVTTKRLPDDRVQVWRV